MHPALTVSFHLSLQAQSQELNKRLRANGQSELDWEGQNEEWGRSKVTREVISPTSIPSLKKGGLALLPPPAPQECLPTAAL